MINVMNTPKMYNIINIIIDTFWRRRLCLRLVQRHVALSTSCWGYLTRKKRIGSRLLLSHRYEKKPKAAAAPRAARSSCKASGAL